MDTPCNSAASFCYVTFPRIRIVQVYQNHSLGGELFEAMTASSQTLSASSTLFCGQPETYMKLRDNWIGLGGSV